MPVNYNVSQAIISDITYTIEHMQTQRKTSACCILIPLGSGAFL